ncbi:possible membrane protein [Rhodococcus wratislaviensis]|uniref:Possible membrane protein n=1 Tax=Rhodococcus wratislaviensis TaxID=44752 RepID=A0A402BZG3_RHOWR|nr:glycosyltransferase 87 family protein [Rhodococcus wratislaviensis]GCE36732.1 possible membrane protein [Rhodococcus wratislaviensis]
MHIGARQRSPITAVVVGLAGLAMLAGYLQKARCAGAPFDGVGRSLIFDRIKDTQVCYSDIQFLWLGRDVNLHVFPYVSGGINADGVLTGGTVEYPVLSGVLMWLGGIGSHTDADFLLHSALILAPFGLLTAWMLGRLAGWWALLWSATPPLVLYAFHNWELPVVATSVAAIFVMTLERIPLRTRAVLAAVLLAVGFCLKLYPGAFVLPLIAYVLTQNGTPERRYDVRGAVLVAVAAITTVVAVNLPFALISYRGWRASFTFQENRQADLTTNSIWYWGLRPLFGPVADDVPLPAYDQTVSLLSPLLVCTAFAIALRLGWSRFHRDGVYPWIAVSAAMLCGFLLLHKVHSPQYTLWLIPFFVLLRVPWGLVAAYLVADLSMGIGVFKYFGALAAQTDASTFEVLVKFGVWGRAGLLVVLFFVFLRATLRHPPVRGRTGPGSGRRPILKSPEPAR